jgi:phage-related protein
VREFPREVRRGIGRALYAAQDGEIDPAAKPMSDFDGGSIVEIIAHHRGDTWRVVYTVRLPKRKSKRGIATTERDIELIRLSLPEFAATGIAGMFSPISAFPALSRSF